MANQRSHPCPKCGRLLRPSGELAIEAGDGKAVTTLVYQCDECLVEHELFGEKVEEALTFVLDKDGRPMDPANPDQPLKL